MAFSRVGDDPVARAALARPEITDRSRRGCWGFRRRPPIFLVATQARRPPSPTSSPAPGRSSTPSCGETVDRHGAARRAAAVPAPGHAARRCSRPGRGASLDDVVAEISAIADACIARGARAGGRGDRLAVIGLGKLGGDELNYASDVDLLFLHEDMDPAQEPPSARWPAVTSLARRAHRRRHRAPRRPDLAPRRAWRLAEPSLDATLAYYESRSATWERQAMIKARGPSPVDPGWARRSCEGLAPFVYPAASWRPRAIDDVRRTKVRLEEYIRQRGKEFTEVKRGRGGIRDVEFAVQLLQIVHGRRDADAPHAHHARAPCAALAIEGYVGDDDAEALADAYRFLRTSGAPAADRARPADPRPAAGPPRAHHPGALAGPGRRRRARASRYEATTGARPFDPRAPVLPAAAGSVRRTGASPRPRRRPRRHRGAAGRAGVRRPGPFLRRAGAPGGSSHSHRQGAGTTCSR